MNARIQLQNILHKIETIMAGEDAMSQLEKDLIKSYLLKAAGILEFSDSRVEQEKEAMKAALADEAIEIVAPEMPELKAPEATLPEIPEPEAPEIVVPEIPKAETLEVVQPASEIVEPLEVMSATHSNGESQTMPQDNTLVEMIKASPIDPRYAALFEAGDGSELSDRLANTPIKDLTKSLGINDRILYINELFDGQSEEFADTMDTLNRKHSFEDAQVFLSRHLIRKFAWMNEDKIDRAREFVKLISRRFKL